MQDASLDRLSQEFSDLQHKYNTLNESYLKQQQEKKALLDAISKQNTFVMFPSVDRIPSDKIYDAYTKIYDNYKKIIKEKEIAVRSLKSEIVNNDQQRNYIEILKQTIESSLIKTGLKEKIDSSCSSNGRDLYSSVIEISALQNEIDKLKSENTTLEVTNGKWRNELEYANGFNSNFKEKIQNSLESGIQELEEAKSKIKALENEKEQWMNQVTEANEYNEKWKNIIEKFENENNETNNTIIRIQKNFEEKSKEQMESCGKVKEENAKLNQWINELMKTVESLKENKKVLEEEVSSMKKDKEISNKELSERWNSEIAQWKKEKTNTSNKLKSIQEVNDDLSVQIKKLKTDLAATLESNNTWSKEIWLSKRELEQLEQRTSQIITQKEEEIKMLNTEISKRNHGNSSAKDVVPTTQEIKLAIYNCLTASNSFLQSCRSNPENNKHWSNVINNINIISTELEKCYQYITNSLNNKPPSSDHDALVKEIKSYKCDNKKLYESNKQLTEENWKNFYIGKENKFYVKFITRIIKHHIQDIDIKNILNQILNINDNAICLEIDKYKIQNKIEGMELEKGRSGSTSVQSEILKNQNLINDIDCQIQDLFHQLKQLDSQLKQYENSATPNSKIGY